MKAKNLLFFGGGNKYVIVHEMKILLYFEVCNASAISFHGIFLEYFFAKQLCYMITKTMVPDHMFSKEDYQKKKQKGIIIFLGKTTIFDIHISIMSADDLPLELERPLRNSYLF